VKKSKPTPLEQHQQYVEFLKKRIESENYKEAVTPEEFAETKAKYDKAKFKLKFMLETGQ
jgi:hypothetical protein